MQQTQALYHRKHNLQLWFPSEIIHVAKGYGIKNKCVGQLDHRVQNSLSIFPLNKNYIGACKNGLSVLSQILIICHCITTCEKIIAVCKLDMLNSHRQ